MSSHSLNPAVDTSTSVEKIVPVNKPRCATQLRDPGGGGSAVGRDHFI